ncbi:Beta/Gamma Crystallin Domain-Containing Protein 2, partial [Manis pentadactyla]
AVNNFGQLLLHLLGPLHPLLATDVLPLSLYEHPRLQVGAPALSTIHREGVSSVKLLITPYFIFLCLVYFFLFLHHQLSGLTPPKYRCFF